MREKLLNICFMLIAVMLGSYLASVTFSLVLSLVSFLVVKAHGGHVRLFRVFFWCFEKNSYQDEAQQKESWHVRRTKYRWMSELLWIRVGITPKQEERISKLEFWFSLLAEWAIFAGMVLLYLCSHGYLRNFAFGFAFTTAGWILIFVMSKRKPEGLEALRIEKTRELIDGKDPEEVDFPSLETLSFPKATTQQKIHYCFSRYLWAEMRNDLTAMAEAAHYLYENRAAYLPATFVKARNSMLVSYYSFREKNPEMAKQFYEETPSELEADKDCNGRRILAYYAFYVLGDRERAKNYMQEGLKALSANDAALLPAQRATEERMLLYLKSQIEDAEQAEV